MRGVRLGKEGLSMLLGLRCFIELGGVGRRGVWKFDGRSRELGRSVVPVYFFLAFL